VRACVDLPAHTLVRASVRVVFIFHCVGVRAPRPVCVRVCAGVCVCVTLRVSVGACMHASLRLCARSCTCARAREFHQLALLFPMQARAREVAAEVKARTKRTARRALARLPTASAWAATARTHVARAFLRARLHCWAALCAVSRRASDAPIRFEIGDYF
jgi:hypothetical protein